MRIALVKIYTVEEDDGSERESFDEVEPEELAVALEVMSRELAQGSSIRLQTWMERAVRVMELLQAES